MRGMHSAILYCHNHAVCHRDIKLENFVFERAGEQAVLKLIDFGLSAVVAKGREQMAEQVGTVAFMAPEMLTRLQPKYNTACDMWALGVAMYELLAGLPHRVTAYATYGYSLCHIGPQAMYELLAGFMKRPYSTGPIGNRSYAAQLKAIAKQARLPVSRPVRPARYVGEYRRSGLPSPHSEGGRLLEC